MSSPQVQAVLVTNESPAIANVLLVLSNGTQFSLGRSINPRAAEFVDLSTVDGVNDGDTFTIRVKMAHSGQVVDDDTILVYVDTIGKRGTYAIGGIATAPTINLEGIAWITTGDPA